MTPAAAQSAAAQSAPQSAADPVHEGGCLCGAVRYRVAGDPVAVTVCHCSHCQRNSGSAFSINCVFPREALRLTGPTAAYDDRGDTGAGVRRVFCGACGSPIESQSAYSYPRYAVIKGGTFDEPGRFVPQNEVYCDRALPWVLEGAERPRYATIIPDAI